MSYKKYYLYKKQYSNDNGTTWIDVSPLETVPSGQSIGEYSTLADCEGDVPPSPPSPPTPISDRYLSFKIIEDGTLGFSGTSWEKSSKTGTTYYINNDYIRYSTDGGLTWSQISSYNYITVHSGDTVLWKGSCIPQYPGGIGRFRGDCKFNVEGNVMSLLYGDNYTNKTSLSGKSDAFSSLFAYSYVVNAGSMSLPATTLETRCYSSMFFQCENLTVAPELPATSLSESCYAWMFDGCSSLEMIKCIATDISAQYCTYNWVSEVASNGTFIKSSSMSLWTGGINGIPSGWTVEDA